MSSTSKNAIHIGTESTYDTLVTTDRSYPGTTDDWEIEPEDITVDEIRAGQTGPNPGAMLSIENGGSGKIEMAASTQGMGKLFEAAAGTSSITGSSQTHVVDDSDSGVSLTTQIVRAQTGVSTPKVYTYGGCMVTNWGLQHSAKDVLKAYFDFDWASTTKTVAEATAAYAANSEPWHWRQCAISINSSSVLARSFEININNNLNLDQDYLRSTGKVKPCRTGVVEAEGSFELDLNEEADDLYDIWLNDNTTDFTVTWTNGTNILTLDVNAIKFKNVKPQMSATDLTRVQVDFMVVEPTSGDFISLTYDNDDTAF